MSTETKQVWTPGPWRLGTVFTNGTSSRARIAIVVGPKRGLCVASVMSGGSDGRDKQLASVEANAHLISKSPEMAELLRKMFADLRLTNKLLHFKQNHVNQSDNCGFGECARRNELLTKAERLLADLEAI